MADPGPETVIPVWLVYEKGFATESTPAPSCDNPHTALAATRVFLSSVVAMM
jgi:hypothetical protein